MEPGTPVSPLRVAIVGAGFSGLAAALRLGDLARESRFPLKITVFEKHDRVGGLVQTQHRDGYLIERGADSFITNKPAGIELCRRLGLESQLVSTNPQYRKSFILKEGRPVETPAGYQLLAPTRFKPLLTTPLLSWKGKLRILAEPFIKRGPADADESLADFTRRRLGREALDRIVQPLVGGIYTSDPEKLSIRATLPRFPRYEQEYGSVIRGLRRETSRGSASSGARYGLFVTLPNGLGALLERLADEVRKAATITFSEAVTELRPNASEPQRWTLTTSNHREKFDAVVMSLPADRASAFLRGWNSELAASLGEIEYASSAIVVSGHRLSDIRHSLDGAGLVIPHIEGRRILAVSFASRKFQGRAPDGRVLLRTFVGGAMQPEILSQTDNELRRIVQEELKEIFGVSGKPDFCDVVRYERAMPQYHIGHLNRVAKIESLLNQIPGFALCGNSLNGVGIPDAIESGNAAAEKLWRELTSR